GSRQSSEDWCLGGHLFSGPNAYLLGTHFAAFIQQANVPAAITAGGGKNRDDQALQRSGGKFHRGAGLLSVLHKTRGDFHHTVEGGFVILQLADYREPTRLPND